ncbi:MAG TPA: AAA family ATPase [Candidatus Hydrogenedentes bacterium]|nr:AAA family ATPase [Candidatus Hydrogenedentota bacterium]
MRIRTISIDGYGRFHNRTFDLAPGLQIIYGPNEQGKSTLRAFIADMLYGQKRSPSQRLYHEDNELRCPWDSPDSYGGRLIYVLDNNRSFEVFRRFDRKNETVQIFDRTHGCDITMQFPQLRNREPQFALEHLGLSKEVFLGAATISHLTLEELGGDEVIPSIREKLLALADSGDEYGSAEATLKPLQERMVSIGTATARTKPLQAAKARLAELRQEMEETERVRGEVSDMTKRRLELRSRAESLRAQRDTNEQDRQLLERARRAERLRQAERLQRQIDEATRQCFELSGVRDFPLDRTPEIQRAYNVAQTARSQLDRTVAGQQALAAQLEEERRRLGEGNTGDFQDIPETYDERLAELSSFLKRMSDRMEDLETARANAEDRRRIIEKELENLPDFSEAGEEADIWLNQLIQTFRSAVQIRSEEREKQAALHKQIAMLDQSVKEGGRWFAHVPDFAADAREYEVRIRLRDEQAAQLAAEAERLQAEIEEHRGRVPDFMWLSLLTVAILAGLIATAIVLGNSGIFVAAVTAGLAVFYFLGNFLYARARVKMLARRIEENGARLRSVQEGDDELCRRLEQLIVDAGCETIRELEGKFDTYREDLLKRDSLREAAEKQDRKTAEAEQRVTDLFQNYVRTFASLGETPSAEEDIEPAALRALERFRAYRDARRRLHDVRDLLRRHDAELERLHKDRNAARDEERALALEARRLMRENGYPEESRQDNVSLALRSYRIRMAQVRGKRGAIALLEKQAADLAARHDQEQADCAKHEEALARLLEAGGCACFDDWLRRAEDARKYQELRKSMALLQEQLGSLLEGGSLENLRAAVEADGPPPPMPPFTAESLASDRQNIEAELDAVEKESHALEIRLAERTAALRPVSEIEEERAEIENRVRALEWELEAASHAMAVIEEIARDKHARMAPRLAAIAGSFLREITCGAYDEIFVSRELRISVRIPHTRQIVEDPERRLSKGTVDQIYLALRLAMVQCLGELDESIPMLLDDPFANYDDTRLDQALRLLARLAEKNQIILFTCREDVLQAARGVNAPVLNLQAEIE